MRFSVWPGQRESPQPHFIMQGWGADLRGLTAVTLMVGVCPVWPPSSISEVMQFIGFHSSSIWSVLSVRICSETKCTCKKHSGWLANTVTRRTKKWQSHAKPCHAVPCCIVLCDNALQSILSTEDTEYCMPKH